LALSSLVAGVMLSQGVYAQLEPQQGCRIVRRDDRVALHSPHFVFHLDTSDGLRAVAIENRLTGRTIPLAGPELEADVGLPEEQIETLHFRVEEGPARSRAGGECAFRLAADRPGVSARVTYRRDAGEPVLHKFVEIANDSQAEINRLLTIRLGTYETDSTIVERERGFPVYLDDQLFISLAHPAGWATADRGAVSLRHHPGARLAAGDSYACTETVYGVADGGDAQHRFVEPSQPVVVTVEEPALTPLAPDAEGWDLLEFVEAKSAGGATRSPPARMPSALRRSFWRHCRTPACRPTVRAAQ